MSNTVHAGYRLKHFLFVCFQDKFLDKFLSLCAAVEDGNIPRGIGEINIESEMRNRYVQKSLKLSFKLCYLDFE
jgi:hypothetical protein